MPVKVHTGDKAPESGQYRATGSRTEITMVEGKRVPPNNSSKSQTYILVDKTKHK